MKVIVDRVMIAKGGGCLLNEDGVCGMKRELVRVSYGVRGNVAEGEVVRGMGIETKEDGDRGGEGVYEVGRWYVVMKGGDRG
ncbi:bifunctional hydroxymethylpyrimidine kinase/phosphomethylpyrimidine kinase [Bacillus altitudinis]|uniref:bifunctional hydroxymethylpyrimidine kinase/phosphomethylpyrimidine kinase n=1 Tax=Bacillus altitudinis TaxID=293387 RepID=UPI003B5178A8